MHPNSPPETSNGILSPNGSTERHAVLRPGRHEPMGAHVRDGGVNFAVFSRHALRIELCLFDASGERELQRIALHGPYDGVFHGFIAGAQPGLVYGLRAHGPYAPEHGHRFNPFKLLLDPCAREIVGSFHWCTEHYGYQLGHPSGPYSFDTVDNARQALKARVVAKQSFDRLGAPRTEIGKLVLYEVHVKGFSQLHPGIPADLRGTYGALAHPTAIAYFKKLGVTTLSLLPVHYAVDEAPLAARGLVNFWGYNTLGFFCPSPRLSTAPNDPSAARTEFRAMVQTLHAHGLEVVLDVVYNHTAEMDENGPTLSFRGLDHASWYTLLPGDHSRCANLTGCGNTVNAAHPQVTQFILDSLRFWVQEMGVDGFRFDLAPVLGRTPHGFDPSGAFLTALRQDPILNTVHLIAEPWDAANDGYQVGRFPGRFLEWNDKFRDTVRSYWLQAFTASHLVDRGEFARRFTGSNDLFHNGQRQPTASVNFITAHDGYTLADMLRYSRKHNEANGEGNRDGRDGEMSHNFGIEGASDDAATVALRKRVARALMATLVLAQGTPMLCAGDESGKTQGGNNNAYCQDNPTTWMHWEDRDTELEDFVARVLALRRDEPLLRHTDWFDAQFTQGGPPALRWLRPDGAEMQTHDWHDRSDTAFACKITAREPTAHSQAASAHGLMLAFNPTPAGRIFCVEGSYRLVLDSSGDSDIPHTPNQATSITQSLNVPSHTLLVLRQV